MFWFDTNRKLSLNMVMKKWESVQWNSVFLPTYFYVSCKPLHWHSVCTLMILCSRCLAEWWVGGSFLTASLPALFLFPHPPTSTQKQHNTLNIISLLATPPALTGWGLESPPSSCEKKKCCVLILTYMSDCMIICVMCFPFFICTIILAIRILIFEMHATLNDRCFTRRWARVCFGEGGLGTEIIVGASGVHIGCCFNPLEVSFLFFRCVWWLACLPLKEGSPAFCSP